MIFEAEPRDEKLFARYRDALVGTTLSAFWFGYGTALFLEFGRLAEMRRRDGSPGSPRGEFSVMIQFDWRVESGESILVGSASDSERWHPAMTRLVGKIVEDVTTYGALPELVIQLSGSIRILSFMTDSGQPQWTIFQNGPGSEARRYMAVEDGRLLERDAEDGGVQDEPGAS